MKVKLTKGPHEGEELDLPNKQALAALKEGWAEPPAGMQLVTEKLPGPVVDGYETFRPGATYMAPIEVQTPAEPPEGAGAPSAAASKRGSRK